MCDAAASVFASTQNPPFSAFKQDMARLLLGSTREPAIVGRGLTHSEKRGFPIDRVPG